MVDLVNSGQLVFQGSDVCDMAVQDSEAKYHMHIVSFVSLYFSTDASASEYDCGLLD
jgi:hypothetical protein